MAKRLLKTLLLPILALATALAFIACDGETTPPDVKFTVTYKIGADASGTAPTETNKAVGEKFKIKSADDITPPTGKMFGGWNDGSLTYQVGDTYTMPEKAVTFTAQWDDDTPASKYTVTYKHGAAVDDNGDDVDNIVAENQLAGNYTVGNPSLYIYDEEEEAMYLFSGWVNEKNKNDEKPTVYLPGQTLTLGENTTLEAVWVEANEEVFSAMDTTESLVLYAYPNGIGTYWLVSEENPVWAFFTYTLSQGTITATPVGGSAVTGTIDENGKLTMSIQINGHTYNFAPAQELPEGKPTVSFEANGGTGTAPVIADADITATTNNQYNVVLPQCTYTAPNGKEFSKWEVLSGTKSFGTYAAGSTFKANAGEKLTLKATWKDAAVDTPTGTEYFGNCHLVVNSPLTPVNVNVKAIIFDVAKGTMYYRIDDSLIYKKSTGVQNQDSDNNKPNDYGANAKFYEVKIEGAAVYLLLDVDNKLKLYNTSYDAYDNGEFNILNLNPTEYTVTFDPNNEEDTWDVTVSSIGIVQKPQTDPVHPGGKAFRYWKDSETGEEYIFGSSPTGNITLEAVYAWKVTYSAGEGNGTIEPVYVNMWTGAGIILNDASDINNGSKVFAGWWDGTYQDDEQTVKNIYDAGKRYVGTGNVTLTAQWEVPIAKYTVTFEKASRYADISKVTGDAPVVADKQAGEKFNAPACTYTFSGNKFKEWQVRKYNSQFGDWEATGDVIAAGAEYEMPAYNIRLYAVWEQDTAAPTIATVTYKAGEHGTGADVVKTNVPFSTTYKLIDNPFTVENFYTFAGWKVEGDDSDSEPLTDKYNLTDDVVFVAQYANMYFGFDNDGNAMIALYFDLAMGEMYYGEDGEVMFEISVSGNDITLTSEDGDESVGTFVNNTLNIEITVGSVKYTFGNPNADTTEYTVTYVLGEGVTGTAPTETDKAAGAKFTLAAGTGLSNGEQKFDGWSDGTTKYAAGAEYTMPDHAVTFTAQWKPNAPLTWENINPESGALFNFVSSCANKEAIYLFENTFEVSGYTFVGLKFYVSNYNNITAGTNNPHLYVQPIYYKTVDGKGATKAGTGLPCKTADNTDPNKLRYTSNSYAINVQTSGGSYYVTSFKYGSANPEVAMQLELVYTTKTVDDLKV